MAADSARVNGAGTGPGVAIGSTQPSGQASRVKFAGEGRSADIQPAAAEVRPRGKELVNQFSGQGVELFDLVTTAAVLP